MDCEIDLTGGWILHAECDIEPAEPELGLDMQVEIRDLSLSHNGEPVPLPDVIANLLWTDEITSMIEAKIMGVEEL